MSWHGMSVKTIKKGATVIDNITIDVAMDGATWVWRQVDDSGKYCGPLHGPFATERDAKQDAFTHFGAFTWA